MSTPGVTLSASISINAVLTGTHALTPGSAGVNISEKLASLPGTATIDQTDVMFADTRTLANNGTENLDLTGTLVSPLGVVVAAAEITLIYIKVTSGNLIVGGASANAFNGPLSANGTYALAVGEAAYWTSRAGWPVVAATGDLIKILAGSAGATYSVVLIGRSVAR